MTPGVTPDTAGSADPAACEGNCLFTREAVPQIVIDTPAKINLWLEVIEKRGDGYHELSSLMLPVGIYDRISLTATPGSRVTVDCDNPDVPSDSRNIAWRAADSYIGKARLNSGVQIGITKRIPVGAGLGGGSSNAAAVLIGMNHLFDERISGQELHQLATTLGADVPFFLQCKPALATGIGEHLQLVDGIPTYHVLMIKPPISVSTRHVYGSLKLTRGQSRIKLPTLLARPWQVDGLLENDLESVTLNEQPILHDIKSWLLAQGAAGALMSGSGPTVFGVFSTEEQALAASGLARQRWTSCWLAATNTAARMSITRMR